jgi:hypothetical protein
LWSGGQAKNRASDRCGRRRPTRGCGAPRCGSPALGSWVGCSRRRGYDRFDDALFRLHGERLHGDAGVSLSVGIAQESVETLLPMVGFGVPALAQAALEQAVAGVAPAEPIKTLARYCCSSRFSWRGLSAAKRMSPR